MPDTTVDILIVDDDEAMRTSLSLALQDVGYAVRASENGFSALFDIGELVPDILIADMEMPRMPGNELISVVRRRFPEIRLIAMSDAFTGSEMSAGVIVDSFYQKGSSMRSLLQIVSRLAQSKLHPPPPPASSIQNEMPRERSSGHREFSNIGQNGACEFSQVGQDRTGEILRRS